MDTYIFCYICSLSLSTWASSSSRPGYACGFSWRLQLHLTHSAGTPCGLRVSQPRLAQSWLLGLGNRQGTVRAPGGVFSQLPAQTLPIGTVTLYQRHVTIVGIQGMGTPRRVQVRDHQGPTRQEECGVCVSAAARSSGETPRPATWAGSGRRGHQWPGIVTQWQGRGVTGLTFPW